MVAGLAGAVFAGARYTEIIAVLAFTGGALVVVTIVLAMGVAIVQVVNVVEVDNSLVAAVGAVGVSVGFRFAV
ncbi:hypothetical protein A7979_00715 [Rothia nasimurium]|uniref:Uncharacterized protein n=1 Tax=Rothia nasimurium TaxID=85336 RepID=A0A1Y1RRQ9_9MICC|nr:hypothetical protein A7979_00715 [Rothia nasimurium]